MSNYGWYLRSARFSVKPCLIREGPYWAFIWAGIGLTNLNAPLVRRLNDVLRRLEAQ